MEEILYDIKDLLTDIVTLLESIADNNIDMARDLSRIAGRGRYDLEDIYKGIESLADKFD